MQSGIAESNDELSYLQELQDENERLRGLIKAFGALDISLDLGEALNDTLIAMVNLVHAQTGSIALLNEEETHLEFLQSTDLKPEELKSLRIPLGQGIAGDVAQTGKVVRVEDVRKDSRFYSMVDKQTGTTTQSYLCVPLIISSPREKIIGTTQVLNREDGESFSRRDEELLEGFARQAAMVIHNARMHRILLRQKAIESELEVCADIQKKIFPEDNLQIPGYDIFGSSEPCKEVGGDYYSYIPRSDGSADLVIADVTGKGLPAAMMVAELHTAMQLLSQRGYDLRTTIQVLHEHLVETLITGKFVSLFVMRIHPESGYMEYVLAGHPSPFIISKDGKNVRRLDRTGMVLGVRLAPTFQSGRFLLEKGDLLMAFTDGYSESISPDGEMYGENQIGEFIRKARARDLPDIARGMDVAIRDFTDDAPAPDDNTLLLLRRL